MPTLRLLLFSTFLPSLLLAACDAAGPLDPGRDQGVQDSGADHGSDDGGAGDGGLGDGGSGDAGAGDGGAGDGGAGDGGGDGGTDPEPAQVLSSVAEPTKLVPSVVHLQWETDQPVLSRVRFGEGEDWSFTSPAEDAPATRHRALLVGVPENTAGHWQIDVWHDGAWLAATAVTPFTTGGLDPAIPRPVQTIYDDKAVVGGFTMVPIGLGDQIRRWATVLDERGRLVWAVEVSNGTLRMRRSLDGQGVVTGEVRGDGASYSLVSRSWDGTERWILPVEGGRHDFDLVDDDTFVVFNRELVTMDFPDGPAVVANDGVIEVGLDGSRRPVWSVFDLHQPDTNQPAPTDDFDDGIVDWSHANYLSYDSNVDAFHVVLRYLEAAVLVDRSSGDPVWTLAADFGDFPDAGDNLQLGDLHSAELWGDDLLLFDEGLHSEGGCARAYRVSVDPDRGLAHETWSYQTERCIKIDYLGNALPLPGDNLLVSFARAGLLDEAAPEGHTVSRLELGPGTAFLYAERVPNLTGALP